MNKAKIELLKLHGKKMGLQLCHFNPLEINSMSTAQGGEELDPTTGIPIFARLGEIIETPKAKAFLAEFIAKSMKGDDYKPLAKMAKAIRQKSPHYHPAEDEPELEQEVAAQGIHGDSELGYAPENLLKFFDATRGGEREINPHTGLPMYGWNPFKASFWKPVARIALPVLGGILLPGVGGILGGTLGSMVGAGLGSVGASLLTGDRKNIFGRAAMSAGLAGLGNTLAGGNFLDAGGSGGVGSMFGRGGGTSSSGANLFGSSSEVGANGLKNIPISEVGKLSSSNPHNMSNLFGNSSLGSGLKASSAGQSNFLSGLKDAASSGIGKEGFLSGLKASSGAADSGLGGLLGGIKDFAVGNKDWLIPAATMAAGEMGANNAKKDAMKLAQLEHDRAKDLSSHQANLLTKREADERNRLLNYKWSDAPSIMDHYPGLYDKKPGHYAKGGLVVGKPVKGRGTGQSDDIKVDSTREGEWIWTAHDVASMGDGSTDAGWKNIAKLEKAISSRPDFKTTVEFTNGKKPEKVKTALSNGEYRTPTKIVTYLGQGNNKQGAEVFRNFINNLRNHKMSNGLDLPPPIKDPIEMLKKSSGGII